MSQRTAVCISGIPKYWNNGLNSVQQYFSNADVFIFTWNISRNDINSDTVWSDHNHYNDIGTPEGVIAAYKPKEFLIESFSEKNVVWQEQRKKYRSGLSVSHLSNFYGRREVTRLKRNYELKNNFQYDLVIWMRFDSCIRTWNTVHEDKNNLIFIPNGCDYGGMNDQFCYGNSELMDLVGECYTDLDNIVIETNIYAPEANYNTYLQKVGILPGKLMRTDVAININNYQG
jgi:hypothetical protein